MRGRGIEGGLAPSDFTLTYGSHLTIEAAGHTFYGICTSDRMHLRSSGQFARASQALELLRRRGGGTLVFEHKNGS